MIRISFMIFTWALLCHGSTIDPGFKLMRTSSKSDEAFANVISEINQFIKDKHFDVHELTNLPLSIPFVSLNFSNGQMRDFSSIELHKSSVLQDGRRLYWTLGVGLGQFSLQYDFSSNFFSIFENSGNLKVTVPKTNILLSGILDVSSSKCSTTLEIVTFMNFPNFDFEVEPSTITNFFFKQILGFAVNRSKLLLNPTLNSSLKDFILDLVPLTKLNEVLCKYLNKYSR